MFESTFSSETCTLNHSQTNPTSPLHNSSFLTCANTPNEDVTDEERTSPSHIELADEQYSSPAEVFLNRKLQLLRAKLEPLAETSLIKDNSYSTVQALMLSETSLQEYEKAEKTFAEACLGRLNISECPSVNKSRSPQHIEICTARPLTAQYERLKIESLQHRMETQIKVG